MKRTILQAIKERRGKAFWFAVGLVVLSLAAYFFSPTGPRYDGEPASYWLDQHAEWQGNLNDPLKAFLAMRDEGAIFLANEATTPPSRMKQWLVDQGVKHPKLTPKGLRREWLERRKQSALLLLEAMGTEGKAASPIIIQAIKRELVSKPAKLIYIGPSGMIQMQRSLIDALTSIGSDDPAAVDTLLECIRKWYLPPRWPGSIGLFTPAVKARHKLLEQTMYNQTVDHMAAAVLLASVAGKDDEVFNRLISMCQDERLPRQAFTLTVSLLTSFSNRANAVAPLAVECLATADARSKLGYMGSIKVPPLEDWLTQAGRTNVVIPELLFKALNDPKTVNLQGVVRVLGDIRPNGDAAYQLIEPLFKPGDFELRVAVAEALWKLGQKETDAVRLIMVQLDNPEVAQVRVSARLLGNLGIKAQMAAPRLKELLNHVDNEVRLRAKEALEKIEGK